MVDCIEYCVNQTGDHVGQAREELIKAEDYQIKSRKVMEIRHQTNALACAHLYVEIRAGAETTNLLLSRIEQEASK